MTHATTSAALGAAIGSALIVIVGLMWGVPWHLIVGAVLVAGSVSLAIVAVMAWWRGGSE